MKIFWDNLVDYSTVQISASSAAEGTPASNIAHEHRKRVWCTTDANDNDWILVDFGSSRPVTAVIILDHNFQATDGLTLEGCDDSDFADPFSLAIVTGDGAIVQEFPEQSFRYWRLKFNKPIDETRQIGRLFLGSPLVGPVVDQDGYEDQPDTYTVISRGPHGQEYSDIRANYTTVKVSCTHVSSAVLDTMLEFSDSCGKHRPFFYRHTDDDSTTGGVVYCKLDKLIGRKAKDYDRAGEQGWSVALQIREQV